MNSKTHANHLNFVFSFLRTTLNSKCKHYDKLREKWQKKETVLYFRTSNQPLALPLEQVTCIFIMPWALLVMGH